MKAVPKGPPSPEEAGIPVFLLQPADVAVSFLRRRALASGSF